MRMLIAFVLAMPVIFAVEVSWVYIFVIGLQVLAGLDFELFREKSQLNSRINEENRINARD
ncbi:hypothetical protein [Halalkalibacter oceani]|uniref:hypothetical protein n=1 Tax=Halalkalibacter oceani TaxID=1653776 RepID=UPI003396BA68